jgi:hypothetical protein
MAGEYWAIKRSSDLLYVEKRFETEVESSSAAVDALIGELGGLIPFSLSCISVSRAVSTVAQLAHTFSLRDDLQKILCLRKRNIQLWDVSSYHTGIASPAATSSNDIPSRSAKDLYPASASADLRGKLKDQDELAA